MFIVSSDTQIMMYAKLFVAYLDLLSCPGCMKINGIKFPLWNARKD